MSQVNFLPPSFVSEARANRRRYRHVLLLMLLATVLVCWGFAERGRNVMPRIRAAALEAEVRAARDQMSEFVKLRTEQNALLQEMKIRDELRQPVSHTQVIAALDRHLPRSVGLTALKMVTLRPPPRPIEEPGKTGRAKPKRAEPTERMPDQLDIELDALAPNDLVIARLIDDLTRDELFDQVMIKHSRTTEVRGVEARRFRLTLRVRFDRRFDELEVAHAD